MCDSIGVPPTESFVCVINRALESNPCVRIAHRAAPTPTMRAPVAQKLSWDWLPPLLHRILRSTEDSRRTLAVARTPQNTPPASSPAPASLERLL